MFTRKFSLKSGRALSLPVLAFIGLFALLSHASAAFAQNEHVKLAPPGDHLDAPGPLATGLSPKLTRPELAKAMKLVADWQLGRTARRSPVRLDLGRALRRLHECSRCGSRR